MANTGRTPILRKKSITKTQMSKCMLDIQGYDRILSSSVVMVKDFCSCGLGLNPAHLIICLFVTDLDSKKNICIKDSNFEIALFF